MKNKLKLFTVGAAGFAVLYVLLAPLFSAPAYTKLDTKSLESPQSPQAVLTQDTKQKIITKIAPSAERTVFITGEIGPGYEEEAKEILTKGKSTEPLFILIDSPGGSVFAGNILISAIEAASGPVYTVCTGLCASMAAMMFEYGTKRYMVDRSIVMFHPASGGDVGEVDKMVSRLGFVQHYISKTEAYVARKANLTFAEYKAASGIEHWIDAEDAVNSKFADGIVSVLAPDKPAASNPFAGNSEPVTPFSKNGGIVVITPPTWITK